MTFTTLYWPKQVTKSDPRGGEVGSTLQWEKLQSHIMKGHGYREGNNYGHSCKQHTIVCHFSVSCFKTIVFSVGKCIFCYSFNYVFPSLLALLHHLEILLDRHGLTYIYSPYFTTFFFLSFPLSSSTPPQYILKVYLNVIFQTSNLVSSCVPSAIWSKYFLFSSGNYIYNVCKLFPLQLYLFIHSGLFYSFMDSKSS